MKVYVVDPATYAGVMTDIANIGKLAGTSAEAQKVVDTMKQAEADVQAKVGAAAKKSTFVEIYSKPLMTAGKGTFISDMVGIAGGTNLGDSAGTGFPNFSSEVLLKDDPSRVHRRLRLDEQARRPLQPPRLSPRSPRSRTATCT